MIMKELFEHVQVKFSNDLKQPGLGKLCCLCQEMLSPLRTKLRHHTALWILDQTSWEYFNMRNNQSQVHSKRTLLVFSPQDCPFPCTVLIANSVFKLKKVVWK